MAEETESSTALPEKDKILHYFAEAARLWSVNAELVISKDFFQLWQQAWQPRPFPIAQVPLYLGDMAVDIYADSDQIGWFDWDSAEGCAVLRIEGNSSEQTVLLSFADALPQVSEQDVQWLEEDEMSLGERLEIMYDVIAEVRRGNPQLNILQLSRSDYEQALTALASSYDKRALAVMRRLTAPFRNRLLHKAAADMAVDELSNQLTLPLDGNYAMSLSDEFAGGRDLLSTQAVVLPGRTPWAAQCDLQLLSASAHAAAELESVLLLELNAAEVLQQGRNRSGYYTSVRVPLAAAMALTEGEQLPVVAKGERMPVARFCVDVLDRNCVYGHILWEDQVFDLATTPLVARPRKGPEQFIAGLMANLETRLGQAQSDLSTAVHAALGSSDCSFELGSAAAAPAALDSSQQRAWRAAVTAENAIVLIQGPPGTGKTSVLENVLRTFCEQGQRVLVVAPSNTAVDNVCRRVVDLPILRFGWQRESVAPDVRQQCWAEEIEHVQAFAARRKAMRCGGIFAGTPIGLLRNSIIQSDVGKSGRYDVIVFDEAGMARLDEFLLIADLGQRAVLFGDHLQLPPFPMFEEVRAHLLATCGQITRSQWLALSRSALEWLQKQRQFPLMLLQRSYRCQNPRLMRFASTLFYDARVKASEHAEYYRLNYNQRQKKYPPSTLRLLSTSAVPQSLRQENFSCRSDRVGIENPLEAQLCVEVVKDLAQRYPLSELTVITPYKRQVHLIRHLLRDALNTVAEAELRQFLHSRVATVDSFQGGESDAVVISYVRSGSHIGFVDDPQRINVAHTRCRREMIVIADMQCLKQHARSDVFVRMERAMRRDGEVVEIDAEQAAALLAHNGGRGAGSGNRYEVQAAGQRGRC